MYINFKLLKQNDLTAQELLIIQGIKQKEYELFQKLEYKLLNLQGRGFLELIQGTKGQPLYTKFRLSKKGKTFLRDLEVAEITEDVKRLATSLITMYNDNGLDKNIGNKKKIVELLSWFVSETNFENIYIIETVSDYLTSTEPKYTSRLENLIWKGDNVFSVNWNLSQSKLYQLMKK